MADGFDGDLGEGPEIGEVVVVRPAGAADPNPFDLVAVRTGRRPQAVGRVLLERERAAPADIHLCHRHAGRLGEDREDIARPWQRRKPLAVKVRRDGSRCEVDDGRIR